MNLSKPTRDALALLLLGVVGLALLFRFGMGSRTPEYGSEEYRKMFPASADPQRFEKARELQQQREANDTQLPASDDTQFSAEACSRAQKAVRERLKAPSTAKFPGCVFGANEYEIRADAARATFWVIGHVDSQNSFGAMLRNQFVVKLQRTDSTWNMLSVTVE